MKNPSFILISFSGGLLSGAYGGWQSVLDPILLPLGYSQNDIAWIGFVSIVAGSLGGIVIGKVADVFFVKRFKLLLSIGFVLTLLSFLWFSASANPSSFLPHTYWIVLTSCTIGGLVLNAITPVFYEFCVELTYPVPGGTSGGFLTVLVNIGTLIYQFLDDFIPPEYMNWIFCVTIGFAFLLTLLAKEQYKRVLLDQK